MALPTKEEAAALLAAGKSPADVQRAMALKYGTTPDAQARISKTLLDNGVKTTSVVQDVGSAVGNALGLKAPDLSGVNAAIADSQAFARELQNEMDVSGRGQAPTIEAANIDATNANPGEVTIDPVERAAAAQIGAARQVAAPSIAPVERVAGQQVNAVSAQGATISPMERAAAERASVERAQDTSGLGDRQIALVQQLEARSRGQGGPSAAEEQLRMGLEEAQRQALSQAAGARGTNRGAAMRAGMRAAQETALRGTQQAALLRAQEMQQATGQLSEALQGTRGQELQLALANAAAGNQAALANARMGTDVSQGNAQAVNQAAVEQARLAQANAEANADRGQNAQTTSAQMRQQAALANAGAQNEQQALAAKMALEASTGNANRATDVDIRNAEMGQQVNLANAGATNTRAGNQAQLTQQRNLAVSGQNVDLAVKGAELKQQAATANQGAALTTRGQNIGETAGIRGDVTSLKSAAIGAEQGKVAAAEAGKDRRAGLVGGLIGAAGTVLASGKVFGGPAPAPAAGGTSDRRAKTDIVDLLRRETGGSSEDDALKAFLEDLHPYAYRYKDPADGEGARVGVMAQDLEKNPVGRTVVSEDATGKKQIDTAAAVGVTLAALAKMRDEMDRLKASTQRRK